jgi:16S rRNA (uracil1498-N3)-methyltransferase
MDEALRRSAAHVLVADLAVPALDPQQAHHLARVLRLRDGVTVTVTDGAGHWRESRWVDGALEPSAEVVTTMPPREVTVAVASPKGDRLDWLVQKVTEVGVTRLVLIAAERSVVRWDVERGARQLDRLGRIAAEAAMQSRRVWLPEVIGPVPAAEVLATSALAEPGGRAVTAADRSIAIGPEGGWSPAELALATDRVSLGEHVLRVETAAIVAATLMGAAA